jgi:hypothetical protein
MTFTKHNDNRFVLGGVGAISRFARSALRQRAAVPCIGNCENDEITDGGSGGSVIGPGGEPNPSSSGFEIWYDGQDKATYQPTLSASTEVSGEDITQWNDKSATAHNANKYGGGSGILPRYVGTGTSYPLQNGNTYVAFDRAQSQGLAVDLTGAGNWLANQQNITMFLVFKIEKASFAAPDRMTVFSTSTGELTLCYDFSTADLKIAAPGANNIFNVAVDAGVDHSDVWVQLTMVYDGLQATDAQKLQVRINGTSKTSTFSAPQVASSVMASGGNQRIALAYNAYGVSETDFMNGNIGEVLMYTRTLDSTEVGEVENYLLTKWDL